MGTQLQEWKGAVVAISPHAPKAVAAGWVVTRLFVYEAAILLPINTWISLIPVPSVSILIIVLATLTINVLSASTDAARLLKWFHSDDSDVFLRFEDLFSRKSRWHERIVNQILVSFKTSMSISFPIAIIFCVVHPTEVTAALLYYLPSLTISLTAIMLSPMPLASYSPHWFPVASRLLTAHLTQSMMFDSVRSTDWDAVMKHARWATFARMVWILGRIIAAVVWQLPALVCFYLTQRWLWPTSGGTWVGLSFMVVAGGFTAIVSAAAAIRDWRCIASTLYQRDASIDCHGIMTNVLASFDKPVASGTSSQANALFILQMIPITAGLIVGRATYSLPVAILFIAFVAYSQFHAVAWSYAGLAIRLPYVPPIIEQPTIRRPTDEVVGEAIWTSESDIRAIADDILRRAEQGLEED